MGLVGKWEATTAASSIHRLRRTKRKEAHPLVTREAHRGVNPSQLEPPPLSTISCA
uniref:Uncharacterized protein n=1 Tax=Cucumis melo TaxID=3656 RepID=A0A9I9DVV3_CUCME